MERMPTVWLRQQLMRGLVVLNMGVRTSQLSFSLARTSVRCQIRCELNLSWHKERKMKLLSLLDKSHRLCLMQLSRCHDQHREGTRRLM